MIILAVKKCIKIKTLKKRILKIVVVMLGRASKKERGDYELNRKMNYLNFAFTFQLIINLSFPHFLSLSFCLIKIHISIFQTEKFINQNYSYGRLKMLWYNSFTYFIHSFAYFIYFNFIYTFENAKLLISYILVVQFLKIQIIINFFWNCNFAKTIWLY